MPITNPHAAFFRGFHHKPIKLTTNPNRLQTVT